MPLPKSFIPKTPVVVRRPPGVLRHVFWNRSGWRAGWRLVLYTALLAGVAFAGGVVVPAVNNPVFSLAAENGLVLWPVWVMSKIEKRPMGMYGLPKRAAFIKHFWLGWLTGFIEVSTLVGFLKILHIYSFGALSLQRADILKWGLIFFLIFVEKSLFYQLIWRGYSQYTLGDGIGFWSAAVVLSALWAGSYLPGRYEDLIGLPSLFVVGLLWCFTLQRTGSLWFAVGMNASFDFGGTFLYSMPNLGFGFPSGVHLSNPTMHGPAGLTGGAWGIEGSLLRILTVGVLVSVFNRLYPRDALISQDDSKMATSVVAAPIPNQSPLR